MRTFMRARVLAVLSLVAMAGCDPSGEANKPAPQSLGEVAQVKLGGQTFALEVARTPAQQQIGLMHRKQMPADHGMIFIYDPPAPTSMWMKNTHIPLEVVWVDERGKVIGIASMRPYDLTSVAAPGAVKYAIELNDGASARVGLRVGDRIEMPALLQ